MVISWFCGREQIRKKEKKKHTFMLRDAKQWQACVAAVIKYRQMSDFWEQTENKKNK